MPKGLLNPKNAVESSSDSGFKEGFIRVDASAFTVHQNRERKNKDTGAVTPGEIKFGLVWDVTRLDEDQDPLKDENDNDVVEKLVFGLGSKALPKAHPGKADSPDDEDVEDLGDEVSTAGPTIFLVNPDFKLHKMTALAVLMESLSKAGWKEEYLDRVWAPDYTGSVFHMKTQIGENKMKGDDGKERDVTYKVVDRIVKAGYEVKSGGKGASKAGKSTPAVAEGKKGTGAAVTATVAEPVAEKAGKAAAAPTEAELAITPILQAISEHFDGQRFSRKQLKTMVLQAAQTGTVNGTTLPGGKADPKQQIPAASLILDAKWMQKHSLPGNAAFDMTYDDAAGNVTFGTYAEDE